MGNKESTKRSPTDTRDRFGSDYVQLSSPTVTQDCVVVDHYVMLCRTARLPDPIPCLVTRIRGTGKLMVKGFLSASDPDSIFSDLAEKYKDAATFVRMNVDEMAQFGVQTTPTFILEKDGEEVDRLVGGDWTELESRIEKLIS